jgi:Ca2+-binding RTX toxin-like protein
MSFVTSHGVTITDADIQGYFSHHPADVQVAADAAAFSLTASQIAYALSLGRGAHISASDVQGWAADPSHGYTFAADGTLASATVAVIGLDPPASTSFTGLDTTTADTLNIVSDTTNADPAGVTNTLTLNTTAHRALVITGDAALDLSPNWEVALMSVEDVQAASFNAGLHVYLYGNTNDLDIRVGAGNDIVVAGFGSDAIATGAGDDIIFAGRGPDTVDAGAGNDWIRGGPARDVMTGGPGVDTYAYVFAYESSDSTGVDTITDFQAGTGGDLLDFTALTHGFAAFAGNVSGMAAVNAALHAGTVTAAYDSAAQLLHVDLDANGRLDGVNDITLQLAGVAQLAPGNFIF